MIHAAHVNPIPVTFFPDYRATNPYQTLLYESLEPAVRAEPGTLHDALRLQTSSERPQLFHLHWEHAVFGGSGKPEVVDRFLDDLDRFRAAGGKVIWTIHNLTPHDERKSKTNADLQSGLLELANIVHLHSLPALAAAKAELSLPERKIRVIPHHNYVGAYPVHSRDNARVNLGLSECGMVVLCLGRVAPYKQPEVLVDAFLAVAGPRDRLIIAGQTEDDFEFSPPQDERLDHKDGFVTLDDVGRLHAAADFVVLPYRASLTSGSAVLAATLGRAVVGPDTPGLRDVVAPPQTGMIYQTGTLETALRNALGTDAKVWADRGLAASRAVAARDQGIISAAWQDVILTLARPTFRGMGDTA